jgi:hypothetical protein
VFTSNPFAELSASIPPTVMQTYIVVMILMVVGGTLLDIMHKKSAKYFFNNWQNAKNKGTRRVGSGEMASVAIQTALVDVLASGEFCNVQRRIAHLLTMYGFLAYVITTVIMVFAYPTPATPAPAILPALWYVGALMVCLGGYWFWFFIRVDVAAEGNSPFRLVRADLFVVSLLASATLGLLWAYVQTTGNTTWAKRVFPGSVSPRHDGVIWVNPVVQVLSYVLQARSSLPETGRAGERFEEQPAGPRRQPRDFWQRPPTAPKLLISPSLGVRYRR